VKHSYVTSTPQSRLSHAPRNLDMPRRPKFLASQNKTTSENASQFSVSDMYLLLAHFDTSVHLSTVRRVDCGHTPDHRTTPTPFDTCLACLWPPSRITLPPARGAWCLRDARAMVLRVRLVVRC
jgi:hypothetical protein